MTRGPIRCAVTDPSLFVDTPNAARGRVSSQLNWWLCLAVGFLTAAVARAQPPMVVFPLPDGTPGIQLPFNTSNGVNPFAGDVTVNYGKQAAGNYGWLFDTYQGTSNEEPTGSLGRYAPTLYFDNLPGEELPGPVVAMLEDQDWVFHMEFLHRGPYGQTGATGLNEFIMFAKHVPADSGGTPDGREDRIFNVTRGANANSWSIGVGNAGGGWSTAISNLQIINEQYVDFDVHYRAAEEEMDFYWESQLIGSATTGHGRYDVDFIQFEHAGSWAGIQDFRNFRLGAIEAAVGPVDGDYNGNLIVDAADYVVWRTNLNTAGLPGTVPGDGDDGTGTGTPDGIVDEDDYTFWRARFGADTPLGSGTGSLASLGAAVPEPAGLVLCLLMGLLLSSSVRLRS